MRRNLFVIMAAAAMLCSVISCAGGRSIPKRLDKFVTEAEAKSPEYSSEDWTKSRQEYDALLNEYLENSDKYSHEEKELALKSIGRYHALLIKNGVQKGSSMLKRLASMLPAYLDGFASGLKGNEESLEEAIRKAVDEEKIDKAVEELGKALEGIFGSKKSE